MFYTSNKRRPGFNNFLPVLENILNEVANAPLENLTKNQQSSFTNPKANVIELDNSFEIALAIPGIKKEAVKIMIEKNDLVISAEVEKTEEAPKFKFREFNYGNFTRKFILPENVDKDSITAKFESGVLTIAIQKSEKAQPKSIEIK